MSRTITPALAAELGLTITRPGYLVEIEFASPLRLSTIGDVSFGGNSYASADVQVRDIKADGSLNHGGALVFANTWQDMSAMILNEGIADRVVRVLAVYAGATDEAIEVFAGVCDDATWDTKGRITIRLADAVLNKAFWPRQRINATAGFNTLMPAGTRVTVGGVPYIWERN